jgi:EAL domain-containing protein (putative c-di-GMP-specific phosphodiesterase class I)
MGGAHRLPTDARMANAVRARPQFVSVNLSARQFADPLLTATVAQALCDHDLPGAALELE